MNPKVIKKINQCTGINEDVIASVLMVYAAETLQHCLLHGKSESLFGRLELDDNFNLQLYSNNHIDFDNRMYEKPNIYTLLKVFLNGPARE